MITFVKKLRNRIYGQLTNVAEFFVRVQVVKLAEESVPVTYTTPPNCEPEKKKRKKGKGERRREEQAKKRIRRRKRIMSTSKICQKSEIVYRANSHYQNSQ